MQLDLILKELQRQHYKIYEESSTNEKVNDLDMVLVLLSSSALYDVDSLCCLLTNKKHSGVNSLCRNVLEKYVYMKFILQGNSLNRARDFLLANHKLIIEILEESKRLYPEMMTEDILSSLDDYKMKYKNKRYTNEEKYKWYAYKDKKSIVKLFNSLDEKLYGYYYMKYSGEIHAIDSISKFMTTSKIVMKNETYDNSEVLHITLSSFTGILEMLIEHYGVNDKFKSIELEYDFSFKL